MSYLRTQYFFIALLVVLLSFSIFIARPVAAAEMTITTSVSKIYVLQAQVAYLTAWVEALRDGKPTPPPTFITVLSADTAMLVGTVVGEAKTEASTAALSVCVSENVGQIDWGDGTTEELTNANCSGTAQAFVVSHTYDTTGSYAVAVTDQSGRTTTHVLAVIAKNDQ